MFRANLAANTTGVCPLCGEQTAAKFLKCTSCKKEFCSVCAKADPDGDGSSFECPDCGTKQSYPKPK